MSRGASACSFAAGWLLAGMTAWPIGWLSLIGAGFVRAGRAGQGPGGARPRSKAAKLLESCAIAVVLACRHRGDDRVGDRVRPGRVRRDRGRDHRPVAAAGVPGGVRAGRARRQLRRLAAQPGSDPGPRRRQDRGPAHRPRAGDRPVPGVHPPGQAGKPRHRLYRPGTQADRCRAHRRARPGHAHSLARLAGRRARCRRTAAPVSPAPTCSHISGCNSRRESYGR